MKIAYLEPNGQIREFLPPEFQSINDLEGVCAPWFISGCVLVEEDVPLNVIYDKETHTYRDPRPSDFYSEQLKEMHNVVNDI